MPEFDAERHNERHLRPNEQIGRPGLFPQRTTGDIYLNWLLSIIFWIKDRFRRQ